MPGKNETTSNPAPLQAQAPQPWPEYSEEDRERSAAFYYNCAHGASNSPCPVHFPGAEPVGEDWAQNYKSPTDALGISDSTNVVDGEQLQKLIQDEQPEG